MFRSYSLFVFFMFLYFFAQAQYNYSSNTAHISLVKAIEVNNNLINDLTSNFEKKAQSKPLMFVNVKKKIGGLNGVSNNLSSYIKELQDEVDSERVLYELLEDDFYENLLFTIDGALTDKGEKLRFKIDSLYKVAKNINIHDLTFLDDFANGHFNTNEVYYNAQEKKVNYFEYIFFDTSNYGMMMTMNYLLLDVKLFQLIYFGTVMSY